ncbi:hypothetical protein STSP2_02599 [Anaerohalosphaera lusitana]|uniref:Uncharacterized protein n=1 Tax=Anaerohalosphaera lusitana TaxID=1936003 RepID=A0A1U9NP77_9BACT|nr:hypothetical protein [Anaerohalosphaera lusitana]AQT69410.1 hypothetical protein STSP2_02599 [Anaerohalosphaera lusitana]
MKKPYSLLAFGTLMVLASIPPALFFDYAHYYTFFSIGMLLVMMGLYELQTDRGLFSSWKPRQHIVFWGGTIAVCIFLDQFGLDAGYWHYPWYSNVFDEILKYVFEWAVPFVYLGFGLLIGENFLHKRGVGRVTAFLVSLLVFVTALGIFTEFFNLYVYSWKITDMPFTDAKVGGFFVMFQTFGFWAMAIIGYSKHALIRRMS